jgi:peptidoglycan hydrolase-like protein with peptidoglycan-binding domain
VRKLTAALAAIVSVVAFTAGTAVSDAKPGTATVVAVQKKLGIPADGIVGPQTRRAVRRFQRRNGLTVDGVIGPETLRALGIRARTASTEGPDALLERIARCESGGNPRAVSPDGRYRGKYQFSRATWRSLGGEGDPAKAPEAEQDRLARVLLERQGPSAWPSCA